MNDSTSTLTPEAATYGVMEVLVPSHGCDRRSRHSPVIRYRSRASSRFDETVSAAANDPEVLEVRLCRFTVGRTTVIDTWSRDGKQVAA